MSERRYGACLICGAKCHWGAKTCSIKCNSEIRRPAAEPPPPVDGACWLPLTQGRFALVDEDLFDALNERRWQWVATGRNVGYAAHSPNKKNFQPLHHAVLGLPNHVHIDHRNENGLDCRRENLRPANRMLNGANRSKFKGKAGRVFTSKYKGVVDRSRHLSSGSLPWLARIRVKGHLIHLGRYLTEHEAAVAYDCAAIHHFGEFAKTNFSWKEVAA